MKRSGFLLALVLAPTLQLSAQVKVEVVLDQDQFLPGEALPATVRITNRTGQTLHFGSDPDWLTFAVESRDKFLVEKTGDVPVLGEFALESSKVATKRVNLAPYYGLTRVGSYNIVATVRIKEWDGREDSPPRSFDVIKGAELRALEFGVPPAAGATNQPPEVRKYILEQAIYLRTQLRLYLRLTDASGARVFAVIPIGPMVSFSRPEPQLDSQSNLHLLYQDGARSFRYTVVNPQGDIILRQKHELVNSRPHLQVDKDGRFVVVGGVRKADGDDIPAPREIGSGSKASTP